jgi:hypothetical protein
MEVQIHGQIYAVSETEILHTEIATYVLSCPRTEAEAEDPTRPKRFYPIVSEQFTSQSGGKIQSSITQNLHYVRWMNHINNNS